MSEVNMFEGELNAFLNDPMGPVATELEAVALNRVLPDAYQALGRLNFISSVTGNDGSVRETWQPNPPPGPPMLRSGALVADILPREPMIDETGHPVVFVTSDPVGAGGQHYVKDYLIPRKYHFMGDDPNYTYIDE